MKRQHTKLLTWLHQSLDIVLVVFSFIAAYQVKKNVFPRLWGHGLSIEPNYYLVLLIATLLAPLFFHLFGFYKSYQKQTIIQIGLKVCKAVIGILIGTIFILFILHQSNVSRLLFFLFGAILALMLLLLKSLIYYTQTHYHSRDYNARNILIIGTGKRAESMIRSLNQQKGIGFRILGCLAPFDLSMADSNRMVGGVKVLGSIAILPTMLMKENVDEVIFATDLNKIEFINEYIEFTEELGTSIHILPDYQLEKIMYHTQTAAVFLEEVAGVPMLSISTIPQRSEELFIKSCIDYIAAVAGLILLSPLFLIIMIIIKSTSAGPAFFTQERCGLYGRKFSLFKFRTMVDNAEKLQKELRQDNEMAGPVFKIAQDPRITSFGRFLRKSSLDELPQLVNVLLGQMSLVGPRPPIPAEVEHYKPWQRRRLSMKPGITCIWQVSGRNNIDFNRWMQLDLEYIDNWSLSLDIKILLRTVREVLSFSGK